MPRANLEIIRDRWGRKRTEPSLPGDVQYLAAQEEAQKECPEYIDGFTDWYIANSIAQNIGRRCYLEGSQAVLIALKGTITNEQRDVLKEYFDFLDVETRGLIRS
jgi:hypothetical protein